MTMYSSCTLPNKAAKCLHLDRKSDDFCGDSECQDKQRDGSSGEALCDGGLSHDAAAVGNKRRVLILMSDTGNGHQAAAEAIKAVFIEQFGDQYEVFIADLWTDHTPWPWNQIPKIYPFLAKHAGLYKMYYYGTWPRIIYRSQFAAASTFISRKAAKGLMKYQPDIVISVHPHMQHIPLKILKAKCLLKRIMFTTVVTDLISCHPTWFHKRVSRCYCPTIESSRRAIEEGIENSQIRIYGFPVRPSFVKPIRPKDELRKEFGMDDSLPAVILMGGGEGMGPIEATARALGKALYDKILGQPIGQLVVICGRNKKIAKKLAATDWKIPVQVKGFISKIEEYMAACDCIITKAGSVTIAEAMIRGLPIILNDVVDGQEEGNVGYVVENGCGKFTRSPKEVANIVAQWFGPKAGELLAMSQNALKLSVPDATFKIVNDIHELVKQRNLVS